MLDGYPSNSNFTQIAAATATNVALSKLTSTKAGISLTLIYISHFIKPGKPSNLAVERVLPWL